MADFLQATGILACILAGGGLLAGAVWLVCTTICNAERLECTVQNASETRSAMLDRYFELSKRISALEGKDKRDYGKI